MIWGQLISGGLGVIRMPICLFLISRVYHTKKPGKKDVLICFFFSLILGLIVYFSCGGQFLQLGGEAILIAFLAQKFLQAEQRKSLFISIYYEIAMALGQFLLSAGLGIVFARESFLDENTWQGQVGALVICILAGIGMICLLRNQNITGKHLVRIGVYLAVLVLAVVITLSDQTVLPIPQDTITMWTIFTVILLFAILFFYMNKQFEMERQMADLKAEQAELLEKDYTALNQAYSVNAKLFHDFHNHIGMLRQLVTHEKYKEAIAYLDELQAPVREMANTKWTGEQAIDYLINTKVAAAAEQEIQMQVQVEFPNHTNIKSADLCAIIGNLLDNALEAAKQVFAKEDRLIQLTIRRINQMLIIKVENSFEATLCKENGQLKTTKKDGGLHGWGIKSAMTAAEKYDGMVQTTQDGHIFRAVATLSFHGVELS